MTLVAVFTPVHVKFFCQLLRFCCNWFCSFPWRCVLVHAKNYFLIFTVVACTLGYISFFLFKLPFLLSSPPLEPLFCFVLRVILAA